jgi:hypothetical protein
MNACFGYIFGVAESSSDVNNLPENWNYKYTPVEGSPVFYKFNVPDSLTTVNVTNAVGFSPNTFNNYVSIKNLTLNMDTITKIYDYAFDSRIENFYINDLAKWCSIPRIGSSNGYGTSPVKFGGNLYVNGELVTNLVIPDTISKLQGHTFANIGNIESITIPASVTRIAPHALAIYNIIDGVRYYPEVNIANKTWGRIYNSTTELMSFEKLSATDIGRLFVSTYIYSDWVYTTINTPTVNCEYSSGTNNIGETVYNIKVSVSNPNSAILPNNTITINTYDSTSNYATVLDSFTTTFDMDANSGLDCVMSTVSFVEAKIIVSSDNGLYPTITEWMHGPDDTNTA